MRLSVFLIFSFISSAVLASSSAKDTLISALKLRQEMRVSGDLQEKFNFNETVVAEKSEKSHSSKSETARVPILYKRSQQSNTNSASSQKEYGSVQNYEIFVMSNNLSVSRDDSMVKICGRDNRTFANGYFTVLLQADFKKTQFMVLLDQFRQALNDLEIQMLDETQEHLRPQYEELKKWAFNSRVRYFVASIGTSCGILGTSHEVPVL